MPANFLNVRHVEKDVEAHSVDDPAWQRAEATLVGTYWSAQPAPASRHFTASLLWSDSHFYIKFVAPHDEPPVISPEPDRSKKTIGLWERDVFEIFVAPDRLERNRYFEFEIAPTGEWIDLAIEITAEGRVTDWEYSSEMRSYSTEMDGVTISVLKIPFASLGSVPKENDVWLGNLFRCIGEGHNRGYLAWQPTMTEKPNFHVPGAFGEFRFVK